MITNQKEKQAINKKVNANRRRAAKIAANSRKAKRLYDDVNAYLHRPSIGDLPTDNLMHIANLRASLQRCCNNSLFREYGSNGALEYIASQTCKHKLCPVCNAERQRLTRMKYAQFFADGEMHLPNYETYTLKDDEGNVLVKTDAKGKIKTDEKGNMIPKEKRRVIGHKTYYTKDFDFMHLTLTVPHSSEGWRGKEFYAEELMKEYNHMRKKAFWKKYVFGGEFGVEVTQNENGLHVHIHSLLIVYKSRQNRNELYRHILAAWNKQTAEKNNFKPLPESRVKGLVKSFKMPFSSTAEGKAEVNRLRREIRQGKKSNKNTDHLQSLLKTVQADLRYLSKLNDTGATMVGLENLYILSKKKLSSRDTWQAEHQKWKHYVNTSEPKEFLAGIMECIKYHFEPIGLKKHVKKVDKIQTVQEVLAYNAAETVYDYVPAVKVVEKEYLGLYDLDLIVKILPEIYKRPLYRKFGALHGVHSLNISTDVEEIKETAIDQAAEETINPETGKADEKFRYICTNIATMVFDYKNGNRPHLLPLAKVKVMQGETMLQALHEMIYKDVRENIENKGKLKENTNAIRDKQRRYEESLAPDLDSFQSEVNYLVNN